MYWYVHVCMCVHIRMCMCMCLYMCLCLFMHFFTFMVMNVMLMMIAIRTRKTNPKQTWGARHPRKLRDRETDRQECWQGVCCNRSSSGFCLLRFKASWGTCRAFGESEAAVGADWGPLEGVSGPSRGILGPSEATLEASGGVSGRRNPLRPPFAKSHHEKGNKALHSHPGAKRRESHGA